jgi:hypothetical protein
VKLKKWDSAEHLQTKEDIALYLQACIDEAAYQAAYVTGLSDEASNITETHDAPNSGQSLLHLLSSEPFTSAPKGNSQHLDQTIHANRNIWTDKKTCN